MGIFVGSLITSVIGAVLLLVGDFGGWYFQVAFAGNNLDRYGEVGLLTPYFPVVAALAGLMLYGAYVSYTAIKNEGSIENLASINRAYKIMLGTFIATIVLGIVFVAVISFQDVEDWWLDAGFYGGVVGSGLSALLMRLGLKQIAQAPS